MIIQSLNDSKNLLSAFKDYNETFEVVFLKRNIAQYVEWAISYLGNGINNENFEEFLRKIQLLRADIKTTYILVSQQPLRLDSAIAKAKEDLEAFTLSLNEISVIKEEITSAKDESNAIIESLSSENRKAIENEAKIASFVKEFNTHSTNIEQINNSVDIWQDDINNCRTNISINQSKVTEILTEINRIKKEFDEQQSSLNAQIEMQNEIISKNQEHQKEIQATLAGASKHGLAGSFYTRKQELRISLWLWGVGTILSIILLIGVAYCLIKPVIENPLNFSTITYLARIPIFGALVWLGWFCAKQFGYTTRIREEYSFKYAISMAFEGYKREAAEVNEELLDKLLQITLNSISISPVQCYDTKTNHATPVNEITEGILKEMKPILGEIAKKGIDKF